MNFDIPEAALTDGELSKLQDQWKTTDEVYASLKAKGIVCIDRPKGKPPEVGKVERMLPAKLTATNTSLEHWAAYYRQQVAVMEAELADMKNAIKELEARTRKLFMTRTGKKTVTAADLEVELYENPQYRYLHKIRTAKESEKSITETSYAHVAGQLKVVGRAITLANTEKNHETGQLYEQRSRLKQQRQPHPALGRPDYYPAQGYPPQEPRPNPNEGLSREDRSLSRPHTVGNNTGNFPTME